MNNPLELTDFTDDALARMAELTSEISAYIITNSPTITRARGGDEIEARDVETAYQNFIREQS